MAYRDATEAELREEPTATIEAMARGELGVSPETATLAQVELNRRLLGETTGKVEG